jgi:hypothetical protein
MDHMSIREGQQAWHQRSDVSASAGQRGFADILPFVPLQDDSGTELGCMSGQTQVGVQYGAGPPLKHQHRGTLNIEEIQRTF